MMLISAEDRIAVFGSLGMAGSAIYRTLQARGYRQLLTPSRVELDCLNREEVELWMHHHNGTEGLQLLIFYVETQRTSSFYVIRDDRAICDICSPGSHDTQTPF